MSAAAPRTPARSMPPVSVPPCPSKSVASKQAGLVPFAMDSDSDSSSPFSSPPSSLSSATASPASSPSPCVGVNGSSLTTRAAHGPLATFVTAREVYNKEQTSAVSGSLKQSLVPNTLLGEPKPTLPVQQEALPAAAVDPLQIAQTASVPAATSATDTAAMAEGQVMEQPGGARMHADTSAHVISPAAPASQSVTHIAPDAITPSSCKGKQPEARAEPTSPVSSPTPMVMLPPAHVAREDDREQPGGTAALPAMRFVGNNIPLRDDRVDFRAVDDARSTSTTPTVPTTASERLVLKLEYARVAASARQWYLAQGASLQTLTTWYRNGRGNIRVSAAALADTEEAQAAHAADPEALPAPTPPGPAGYGTMGQITDDFFFGRCDGNYRGPSPHLTWNRGFAQTTLTFALGPPPAQHASLLADYEASLGTVVSLLPANANVRSGHVYEHKPEKHLRLRHTVFEPRSQNGANGVNVGMSGGQQIPSEFSIEGWPCFTDEALAAREAIVDTHVARPLPAYDIYGNLIPPSQYHTDLRGATVHVVFSMTHFDIAQRRANGTHATKCTICLDVQYIRVLIPPAKYSLTKRSHIEMSDPITSTAKKPRV